MTDFKSEETAAVSKRGNYLSIKKPREAEPTTPPISNVVLKAPARVLVYLSCKYNNGQIMTMIAQRETIAKCIQSVSWVA